MPASVKKMLLLTAIFGSGCIILKSHSNYDNREIVVQTASLFNQRQVNELKGPDWKGDWIFRRDRLELIDREFRLTRPDLAILQDVLAKKGSRSDSDTKILAEGGLYGYQWHAHPVSFYPDTGEEQFHAIAVSLPLKLNQSQSYSYKSWNFGVNGYLAFTRVETTDQPLLVFNVQMPSGGTGSLLWYQFLVDRISEVLRANKICRKRLVIGGYLPGNPLSPQYKAFLKSFDLKDSGAGLCSVASDCFTETPLNEIFMLSSAESISSHTDKILIHKRTLVTGGNIILNKPHPSKEYQEKYGLSNLWPSHRYGWTASFRLAKCL